MNEIIDGETTVITETSAVPFADKPKDQPTLKDLLRPARGTDESRDDYIVRRRAANKAVKQYTSGHSKNR